jgi:hypothetical protein
MYMYIHIYHTGRTATWVIGAKDEALYFTHSEAVDPPVNGWEAASEAAKPAPRLRLVWSEEGSTGDQVHVRKLFLT